MGELLYELATVKNEITGMLDLHITNTETRVIDVLKPTGIDSTCMFEMALEEILGSEQRFRELYRGSSRPTVSETDYNRIKAAYTSTLVH